MNGFKALNWKKCYLIGHLTKKKVKERLKKERSGGLHLSLIHCCINYQILPVEDI